MIYQFKKIKIISIKLVIKRKWKEKHNSNNITKILKINNKFNKNQKTKNNLQKKMLKKSMNINQGFLINKKTKVIIIFCNCNKK